MMAAPNFTAGKRYHIVCQQFTQGCVVDGASANQATPLSYLATATTSTETYWLFTEEQQGLFSIRNAKTSQYITYDGVRQDVTEAGVTRRYITMTDALDGRNSLWSVSEQAEGVYVIRNAQETSHIWDVRVDSYVVGTYANNGNGNNNQRFSFYDEQGKQVTEKQPDVVVPEPTGYDVSSWLVATTDALEGWDIIGGWFMNTGAGGSHRNGEASTEAPFIENWHATNNGALDDCSLSQTLTNLPAGNYTLQADMIAVWQGSSGWWGNPEAPATGVSLFAGASNVSVGTANNTPERYQVDFTLSATGDITVGVSATATNANWLAIDNVYLYYNGTQDQLLEGERTKVRAELADYYDAAQIEALIQQAGDDFNALEQLRKSIATLPTVDPLSRALTGLTIDGRGLVYVESLDLYLCSVPFSTFEDDYTATINYTRKEGAGLLYIDNKLATDGTQHKFISVRGGRNYQLRINRPDGTTVTKNLTFTSLPVVRMYGSFNDTYSQGTIAVFEPDMATPETFSMKAKWRGGITNSAGKNKRNYHVKLLDAEGNKLETKFFGLRNDNSWILESCQVDMSRIRNRVLTDLWNDYSTPPYYIDKDNRAMTGTRGQFVELILNDEYRGIYCMTENMDRKQMKLKKYDETTGEMHGMLWKSKDWSYATFMGTRPDGGYQPKDYLSDPNEWSEMWDSYQVKYPDLEDVSPTDWTPLYNTVKFVCNSTDGEFASNASIYFDMPLLIDYYILMETILSTDNHGKNMFFAIYDQKTSKKMTFAVWDMDATCGQRWSDAYYHASLLGPEQDYATFIANNEHGDYNLFKRLRDTNADNFNARVRQRYRDLRDTYLATESILDRFRTYLNEFKVCGAEQREYNKWDYDSDISYLKLNFDSELDYLTDWFTRRMNYLDKTRFDITDLPSAINDLPVSTPPVNTVYNLRGQKVGTADTIKQLPAGIYIIGGRKVVVK